MSNWPNNFDLSHPNWTSTAPNKPRFSWAEYDGKGGYAKNSSSPPWGWPVAIILGAAVVAAMTWGPTLAARIIGL